MIPSEDFYYCPTCQQEIYRVKCKIKIVDKTKSVCVNPYTGGYLDRYRYEDRTEEYVEWYCPNDGTLLHDMYLTTKFND